MSIDSILAAFDGLTLEQQRSLVDQLQRRTKDWVNTQPGMVAEIEVIGGYEHTYENCTRIPLPPNVINQVRRLNRREQVQEYLKNLPDDEILWRCRFLQYRYLEDGSLWQMFAQAHIHRDVSNATQVEGNSLELFSGDN